MKRVVSYHYKGDSVVVWIESEVVTVKAGSLTEFHFPVNPCRVSSSVSEPVRRNGCFGLEVRTNTFRVVVSHADGPNGGFGAYLEDTDDADDTDEESVDLDSLIEA